MVHDFNKIISCIVVSAHLISPLLHIKCSLEGKKVGWEAMAHATAAFDESVRKIIDEWNVPGLGIAIVKGNQIDAKALTTLDKALKHANIHVGLRCRSS